MREIKYRIYDKHNKKMLEVDTLFISEEMFRSSYGDQYDVFNYNNIYYTELMQYTGLKDKNGVEVYEGDIIETSYFDEQKKKKYARDCVKWNDNRYDYGGRCIGFDFNDHWSYIEVIGNIYENKELLKDKQ